MSAVATAGAAAWVVPEILLAKPAAGATLSGTSGTGGSTGVSTSGSVGVSTSAGTTSGTPSTAGTDGTGDTAGVTTAADTTPSNSLAFTGLNIQRDAEVGAALIAGGWAMQHWASRTPKPAVGGIAEAHEAEKRGRTHLGRAGHPPRRAPHMSLRALSYRFALCSDDERLGQMADALLAGLRSPDPTAPVDHWYSLTTAVGDDGGRTVDVARDDAPLARAQSPGDALGWVVWDVNRSAAEASGAHLLFHAGALDAGGTGILVPGASGSGKSTWWRAWPAPAWGT